MKCFTNSYDIKATGFNAALLGGLFEILESIFCERRLKTFKAFLGKF